MLFRSCDPCFRIVPKLGRDIMNLTDEFMSVFINFMVICTGSEYILWVVFKVFNFAGKYPEGKGI